MASNGLPSGTPVLVGTLTSFSTNDPSVACLEVTSSPMDVWSYPDDAHDEVTVREPAQYATASFEFPASDLPG